MDISKLEGIVEAMEAEAQQPRPSHQELARLIAMFSRGILFYLASPVIPTEGVTQTASSAQSVVVESKPKVVKKPKKVVS